MTEREKKLELALREIAKMVQNIGPGIDYDADPYDTSPADATAHDGGLIWQIAIEAIGDDEI